VPALPANSEFFGQRSPQAVLKHGVLVRYAYYFAGRAGAATGGRVAFIDGYAGAGRYDDGTPGSPLLLASQAERARLLGRDIVLAFVEPDRPRREKLRQSLAEQGIDADQLLGEPFEDVAETLLERYRNRAVLMFIDPFGLAVPRSTLEAVLQRSSAGTPVDVLYHFSLSTVARMGAAATADGAHAERNADHLSQALGSVGWEEAFEAVEAPGAPTSAALDVAQRFGASVRAATDVRSTAIEVRQRPDQLPKYLLMLFSRNDRAHWDFADQAGSAYVDWLHHCDRADYEANLRRNEDEGRLPLPPEPAPDREDLEERLGRHAEHYLIGHLADIVRGTGAVCPIDQLEEVYGAMLGRARATHVRAAFKRLHAEGRTDDDATGEFWWRTIRWTGEGAGAGA